METNSVGYNNFQVKVDIMWFVQLDMLLAMSKLVSSMVFQPWN
jgi:hypothetical protein